jgi:hypothetical protein
MLDRSEPRNLFDPEAPLAADEEPESEPEPVGKPFAAARRQRPRSPRPSPRGARPRPTPSRPASPRRRVEAPLTAALAGRFTLPRVEARRLLRYVPVAIVLGVLMTHPAGCGQTVTTNKVTRGVAATTPLPAAVRATAAAPSAPASVTSTRPHRTVRPPRIPRVTPSSAPASTAAAPAPVREQATVSQPPVSSPPTVTTAPPVSYTSSTPAPRPEESGAEFGFER